MRIVTFLGYECGVQLHQYNNGRTAIYLGIIEDGVVVEPMCIATVNLPHMNIMDDEVFIKDYSENTGILQVLTDAGIVTPTGYYATSGHVEIPHCKFHREKC